MAKSPEKAEREKWLKRLKSHYKLAILNIDTFEERFSLLLTPMNVIVLGSAVLVVLVTITFVLLGWTPLRYYLPDYAQEIRVKKLALESALMADSLETALRQRDAYIENFRRVIEGEVSVTEAESASVKSVELKDVEYERSVEDSLLRAEIEKEDLINLLPGLNRDSKSSYLLFPPIKGTVTDRFNPQREHFGVDVTAAKDATIKAVDDGTVVLAAYTAETGHILQIQHDNELISVYKHNSVLLKKQGDAVRAGEAIAIIGETGEYSSGPHLHFEMWRNGVALNPESFFSFE